MRILHTSDWHLGQNFYSKSRAAEHQAFLDWLLKDRAGPSGGCHYCRWRYF
ncbi:Nuclease sbcCD subunit D [Salmonella enterica subsp. enterica]|uniref:Nuclease sbcCD subunit D n=1 Tax=Salmonella enterica I TaxID=59201 RepID=A0A447U903_SALET|nr:Nuclease sbcCD subunit D [Salmonella enterica subsp. enterica]